MTLHCTAERRGKLLSFLRRELKMSDGLVKRLKFRNCFFLDGVPAHTNVIVEPGQEVSVVVREKPMSFSPEHTPLTVLYEDESLLAVDKPAGVIVHPTFYRTEGTLLSQVLGYYAETGQDCAVHPVNRLDRDTCGVVLLAKNSHIHGLCYDLQLAGAFRKTYHALCLGRPPAAEGICQAPIGRVDGGSLLRKIDPLGKPARTEYRIWAEQNGMSLLELHPVTGRTHQLRLHCLTMGCPILGDQQYCTPESLARSEALDYTVQQLCAAELTFPHPLTGEQITICGKSSVFFPKRD